MGPHFKFFIDHSTLHYLVNKLVLWGRICQWLLLFQEFEFEVIIELGKKNVGPYHLSWILIRELEGNPDDVLPNAHLFHVNVVVDQFEDIMKYLTMSLSPED